MPSGCQVTHDIIKQEFGVRQYSEVMTSSSITILSAEDF